MINGFRVPKENWNKSWTYLEELWTKDGTYSSNIDLHRTDGPAVVYNSKIDLDIKVVWCVNGKIFDDVYHYASFLDLSDENINFLVLKYGT